ncbi:MAG: hypothetical protein JW999_00575, partial [Methanotrichaceae archaeon]|nr:hypothetical protein [Methanotrichaceae archaeon]
MRDYLSELLRLLTLVAFFLLVHTTCAQEDLVTPNIVSFDFSPKAVNTVDSAKEITVVAHLTDDMSGFSYLGASFSSPSRGQSVHF